MSYQPKTSEVLRGLLQEDHCSDILEALADLYKEFQDGTDPHTAQSFHQIEAWLRTLSKDIDKACHDTV